MSARLLLALVQPIEEKMVVQVGHHDLALVVQHDYGTAQGSVIDQTPPWIGLLQASEFEVK